MSACVCMRVGVLCFRVRTQKRYVMQFSGMFKTMQGVIKHLEICDYHPVEIINAWSNDLWSRLRPSFSAIKSRNSETGMQIGSLSSLYTQVQSLQQSMTNAFFP